jgi:hypothetical protein
MSKPDTEWRLLEGEIAALRYILSCEPDTREVEMRRGLAVFIDLLPWASAINRELEKHPGLSWADVLAMLDRGPELRRIKGFLQKDNLENLPAGHDPEKGRHELARLEALDEERKDQARIEAAARTLTDAIKGPMDTRGEAVDDAIDLLRRRREREEPDLAALWERHRAYLRAGKLSPHEAVRIDERRGYLGRWINAHLGPRAGLEPGKALMIGGAPEAGKTSLGALVAVDAMTAGCPVMAWQLELGVEPMLEHLMAQALPPADDMPDWTRDDIDQWWQAPFLDKRGDRPMPETWRGLLKVRKEALADVETIVEDMKALAAETERRRKRGEIHHACNGVVSVDYCQLLTIRDRLASMSGHEVIATAASRLVKCASDEGLVLVLLSQLTKESQRGAETGALTALSGGDLGRMPDAALLLNKARVDPAAYDVKGKLKHPARWVTTADRGKVHRDMGKGEARMLSLVKARGTWEEEGQVPSRMVLWCNWRALHNRTMGWPEAKEYARLWRENGEEEDDENTRFDI